MYEHITTAMVTARIRALGLTFTPEQIREKQVFLTVRMVEMSPLGASPSFALARTLEILHEDGDRVIKYMLIVRKNRHRRDGFELSSPQTGWGMPMSFRLSAGQPRGAVQLFNEFQDSIYARMESHYRDSIDAGIRPESISCRNFKLGLVLETGPPNPREHIGREANERIPRHMLVSRVFMNPNTDKHQVPIPERLLNPARHTAEAVYRDGGVYIDTNIFDAASLSPDALRRLIAAPVVPQQQITWVAYDEVNHGTPEGYRVGPTPVAMPTDASQLISALAQEYESLRLDRSARTDAGVADSIDTSSGT